MLRSADRAIGYIGGAGEDVEAEANVEFKPLIEVMRMPSRF